MKAGWKTVPLEELTERITKGSSPKWQGVEYVETPGVLFVTSENVEENYIDLTKKKYVEEKFNQKDGKSILQFGDVLTNIVGASIGRTAVFDRFETANINQAVCLIRCRHELLNNSFLSYLLNSPFFLEAMHSGKTNMARANLSLSFFRELKIPLPPLEEQKRVVTVLDEAFAALDRARTHAETNLKNARELFENAVELHLQELDASEPVETLGEHIDLVTGFAFKSKGYTDDQEGIRLIRGDNILQGEFRWKDCKRWPAKERADYSKFELEAGDVLLAMDRTWVKAGIKYAVVTDSDLPALLVQRVARLRATSSISSEFICLLMGSKRFEDYVLSIQTGLGVPHVSGKQISAFEFPLPSIERQSEIVERVNALSQKTVVLQSEYSSRLSVLEELRQSLLQKAFAGALT